VPGRKTDPKDSEWIALQHGLSRASFVPPTPIRELRDLTRYRASLAQEINRIANCSGTRGRCNRRTSTFPRNGLEMLEDVGDFLSGVFGVIDGDVLALLGASH
jgi:hypothetical protein